MEDGGLPNVSVSDDDDFVGNLLAVIEISIR